MMFDLMLIILLTTLFSIAWYLYAYLYIDYRVDQFRQDLFSIRDKFFDEAVRGNIDFENNAYGMTRSTLNGMIRYAHRLSLFRFIISKVTHGKLAKRAGDSYHEKMEKFISELSPQQKKIVINTIFRMHVALVRHLVYTSLLLLPLVLILGFILKTLDNMIYFLNFIRKYENKLSPIDAEAKRISEIQIGC